MFCTLVSTNFRNRGGVSVSDYNITFFILFSLALVSRVYITISRWCGHLTLLSTHAFFCLFFLLFSPWTLSYLVSSLDILYYILYGLQNNPVGHYCRLGKTIMIRFHMFTLMLPHRRDSCVLTQLWKSTTVVFTQSHNSIYEYTLHRLAVVSFDIVSIYYYYCLSTCDLDYNVCLPYTAASRWKHLHLSCLSLFYHMRNNTYWIISPPVLVYPNSRTHSYICSVLHSV